MKLKQFPHHLKCHFSFFAAKKIYAKRNLKQQLTSHLSDDPFVLSVTSIKPRLKTLHLAIYQVLRDGPKPSAIEIWLDHSLQNHLTSELNWLESAGCTINFIDDLGPHTKLIYCLKKHPQSRIITIDDDNLLPTLSLYALLEAARSHPDAVICNRARKIKFNEQGDPANYREWRVMSQSSQMPEMGIMPLGYGSVLYPPNSLHHSFGDADKFKALCPTGDDLWFMAMRIMKRTMAYNTGFFRETEVNIPGTGKHCIKNRHNKVKGNNNESIYRLFKELDLRF
jgi:hypothetical protein